MREAPVRLRCEQLDDPLAIDTDRPRLSWWLNDSRAAELQTAYQIQAASSLAALDAGRSDLWDTGYVAAQQTMNVEYRGRALGAGSRVWWRVRCYDSDGIPSPWSAPAHFEVGLDDDDWQAPWIAAPLCGTPTRAVPAPLLYRDFELASPPLAARLYFAVRGAALVEINGRAAMDAEPLEPWNGSWRRVPYRAWDVTALLSAGRNRLAAILGDGDYCGHGYGGLRQRHGRRPSLCVRLAMDLADGQRIGLISDVAWRWCPSWVVCADRDRGEEMDGRQFVAGWSRPETVLPSAPVLEEQPVEERFAQTAPVARVGEALPGAEASAGHDAARGERVGRALFDFGRMLFGRIRVELQAPPDATVTVRYAEVEPVGRGFPAPPSPRWVDAADRYTARGDGVERFEPRFAFHAFRWVEITSDRGALHVSAVAALEVSTASASAAAFLCDHDLLQTLFAAADRTLQLGLTLGPVHALSCHGRWVDAVDGEAVFRAALACRDAVGFLRGWMAAAVENQSAGSVSDDGSPSEQEGERLDALLEGLWLTYRCSGDRRLLERLFPACRDRLDAFGERWPAMVRGSDGAAPPLRRMLASAWYCRALSAAARLAGVLGRLSDASRYEELAGRIGQAFRNRFVTRDGLLMAEDQLGYLLALNLGLLTRRQRVTALARLEAQLTGDGFHPRVDVRHGALLLEVLSRAGRLDLAYSVVLQTTPPGWLHALSADAGLLPDPREGLAGRLAAAGVVWWLQRYVLGLSLDGSHLPDQDAYRRVRVQPRPPLGPGFGAGAPVRRVSGHLDTAHGRYRCGWRIGEVDFTLWAQVPGNCSARILLPDGTEQLVSAGTHRFAVALGDLPAVGRVAGEMSREDIPVLREVSSGRL